MELEANSIFVMIPFLTPFDLEIPLPAILSLSPSCCAIIAHIFVDPISILSIALLNYCPL